MSINQKIDHQPQKKHFSLVIAGGTKNTQILAESLLNSNIFDIHYLIVPPAKPVGRQKIITASPLEIWGKKNRLPVQTVAGKKIEPDLIKAIASRPDFLLVADFGYFLPDWLLKWPQIAPINIHPSALPDWRGASPGQMAILSGATQSAVSIIIPNSKMDQGDLLAQFPLFVAPNWKKNDYYQASFKLASQHLEQVLLDLATGKITPQPQPLLSPTPLARQLTKNDGFLPWEIVASAVRADDQPLETDLRADFPDNFILHQALTFFSGQETDFNATDKKTAPDEKTNFEYKLSTLATAPSLAVIIERAWRAFYPWPGIWTQRPASNNGQEKSLRIKLLTLHLDQNNHQRLIIDQVMVEGHNQAQPFDRRWLE